MSLDTTPPGPEPLFPTPDIPAPDIPATGIPTPGIPTPAMGSPVADSAADATPITDAHTTTGVLDTESPTPDAPVPDTPGPDSFAVEAAGSVGPRVCDPDTGWDRFSVIEALTIAARREREAKIDQLILIARAAEVWSWIDNIDDIIDQIGVADRIADAATRDRVRAAAEAGDDTLLDALLTPETSDPHTPASVLYGERLYHYGADGTPACSEFLRLEVGPALGIQPETAARLIGDVLDLRHRLPGMWAHIETGRVLGWVGCQIARKTRAAGLSQELCQELDRRISPYAPGWTPNRILTHTDKLIVILDPDTAETRRRDELARRYVAFWADRHPTGAGMLNMRAQLDAVPAADLEATLNTLAEILDAARPDLTTDARRAWALELLANPAHAAQILTGDLTNLPTHHSDTGGGPNPDTGGEPSPDTGNSGPASEQDGGRASEDGSDSDIASGPDADSVDAHDGTHPTLPPSGPEPVPSATPTPPARSSACGTGPTGAVDAFVKPGTPAAAHTDATTGAATGGGCGCGTTGKGRVPTGREVSLIVHVNPADLILGAGGETPRLGHLVQTLLDDLIAEAARTGRLTIKPVLDPMAVAVSDSDTPPGSMAERIRYRNPTVVFPYSDRASTSPFIDLDHTVPRPHGPTTEPNLGPLDRLAHRWKTHTTCRLVQIRPGMFTWHTPAGQTFTVTPHGTYPDDPGPDWPTPPPTRIPAQQTADLLTRARQAVQRTQGPEPSRPSRTTVRSTAGEPESGQPTTRQAEPPDTQPPPF